MILFIWIVLVISVVAVGVHAAFLAVSPEQTSSERPQPLPHLESQHDGPQNPHSGAGGAGREDW